MMYGQIVTLQIMSETIILQTAREHQTQKL